MAHKAETRDFYWSLSIATFSSYFHVFPAVFISASIVHLQVSPGRPLFLLPLSGVHLNAVRVMLSRSFLIICPSHLHLLCIITVVMFRWPVLWYSSLFVIFWGQYILHIFLRQLQSVFVNSSLLLSYNRLKLNLRVFLAGHIVAMVTYCLTKIIPTCSPVIGQFFDTMIVASIDKGW